MTGRMLAELRRRRSVILGYHGVGRARFRDDPSLLLVRPERFRAQLDLLLDAGFEFVTVAELVRRAGGGTPPPGLAAVSFDDGMRNNRTVALPILRERSISASVYVATGFLGGRSPWVAPPADGEILEASELPELVAAGWEIGAHSVTHPDMAVLDGAACRREMEESRATLEELTGTRVETFAYPFGSYGPEAVAAAREAGFLAALSTGTGSWSPHELRRVMVGGADPLPVLLLKLRGLYEPLLSSAPVRALRAASKRGRGGVAPAGGGAP